MLNKRQRFIEYNTTSDGVIIIIIIIIIDNFCIALFSGVPKLTELNSLRYENLILVRTIYYVGCLNQIRARARACVCVCVFVRACVCVCVRACVRA